MVKKIVDGVTRYTKDGKAYEIPRAQDLCEKKGNKIAYVAPKDSTSGCAVSIFKSENGKSEAALYECAKPSEGGTVEHEYTCFVKDTSEQNPDSQTGSAISDNSGNLRGIYDKKPIETNIEHAKRETSISGRMRNRIEKFFIDTPESSESDFTPTTDPNNEHLEAKKEKF